MQLESATAREAAILREAVMASAGSDCVARAAVVRPAGLGVRIAARAVVVSRSATISNRGKGKHQKQGSDKSKGQDNGKA